MSKEIKIYTTTKKILSDTLTPVAIYLKMREIFPQSILLESSDYHSSEDSLSIICLLPVATITVDNYRVKEKIRNDQIREYPLKGSFSPVLSTFMKQFSFSSEKKDIPNGFFGYLGYDAIRYFENIRLSARQKKAYKIPDVRYSLYKYVITINHFNNTMYITENLLAGESSEIEKIEMFIHKMAVSVGRFSITGKERSNITDKNYLEMAGAGKKHCFRGDVFQIVLSRQFEQDYEGDDFNLYRALRSINPSPYLFYFDYGDYRIFGSSPETHLKVTGNKAYINPIAGTFKRTGNDEEDKKKASELVRDEKESAEHIMLVDLARNDLSKHGHNIQVEKFQEIQFYSHVIHMVSTVSAEMNRPGDAVNILGATFPAGTLTGAPKYKAMELIDSIENQARGFYGGAIGFLHPDGELNHAIMIRSFLSKNNTLFYQAGAGIVSKSREENELQEVNNKLGALKKAILMAQEI